MSASAWHRAVAACLGAVAGSWGPGSLAAVAQTAEGGPPPVDLLLMTNAQALPLVLGGVGAVLMYYGLVWWWVGRDPAPHRRPPRSTPPEGLSPAAVRYVRDMGYDTRCLTAALVNMAAAGWLTLSHRPDGGWRLSRTGIAEDVLFPEERAVANKLFFAMAFERGLDDADGRWLRQASDALKQALEAAHAERLFVTNRWHLAGGVVLSILAAALMMGGPRDMASGVVLALVAALVLAAAAYVGAQAWRRGRQALRGRGILNSLAWFLGLLPVLGIGGVVGYFFLMGFPPVVLAGVAVLVAAAVAFSHLLKAPTAEGRHIQDDIAAFAAFLQQEGAALSDAAAASEAALPYALALDLEQAWAARFGAAVRDGTEAVAAPSWVWHAQAQDLSALMDELGADLTGAIDHAAAWKSEDGANPSGGVSVEP